MTECLDKFAAELEKTHAGLTVKTNYAGTQELKIQVEQGAARDVFVSASGSHRKDLVDEGHVTDPKVLSHNNLCAATDRPGAKVKPLADLAKKGVRLVVATPDCPAGKYTRKCWKKIGAAQGFGPAVVAGINRNVVSQALNVKLVLSKVVLGEADACFVYASDVLEQDVNVIELPESIQVQATYLVGLGKKGASPKGAREYVATLLGETGVKMLRESGLVVPRAEEP